MGIYSRNCTNWVITALSCDAYSRVVVPLYDTLGPKAVAYAVNQGGWVWPDGGWCKPVAGACPQPILPFLPLCSGGEGGGVPPQQPADTDH